LYSWSITIARVKPDDFCAKPVHIRYIVRNYLTYVDNSAHICILEHGKRKVFRKDRAISMVKPLELNNSLVSKDVFDVNSSQIEDNSQGYPL
jgi:hypothetical protein